METSMALDEQELWIVTANIAKLQRQIKSETDRSELKALEGLLSQEIAKQKAILASK
jgi:hypothetical protein